MAYRHICLDVAWYVCLSVCLCPSVGHDREPCKNGGTDSDTVWEAESCEHGNHALGAHWRHVENTMNDLCAAAMRPLVKLLRPSVILRSLSGDSDDALLSYACTNNAKCSCEMEFAR